MPYLKSLAEDADYRQEVPKDDVITLLDQVARQHPHRDAVVSQHQKGLLGIGTVRWSFAQLQEGSITLAACLSALGIYRGARVAAFILNEAEWALVFLATVRLGAQFVPLDPRVLAREEDARFILDKVEARYIFVSNKDMSNAIDNIFAQNLDRLMFKCVVSVPIGTDVAPGWTTLPQVMETVPTSSPPKVSLNANDVILLLCTSGTTSRPKVCPHTSITITTPALALADHWDITPSQVLCQHLPSFHVFSVVMTLAFWLSGATVVFPSASFDPAASFDVIKSNSKTHVPCVPSMAQALKVYAASQEHPSAVPYHIILGGASIAPEVVEICRSLGAKRVTAGYGMTEGVATLINAIESTTSDITDGNVCLGKAIAAARIRICRPETMEIVHRGEIGELHQGGPPIISGYLKASPETNACFYNADGVDWCVTGDQGYMDEQGRVYLLGRYKDLIIRGGENISPTKIESCLLKLPHISVAYAIGIPDAVAGEVPIAVVQSKESATMSASDIQSVVAAELGRSFAPTMILDLRHDLGKENFPTTTSGKIQKATLREWVIDHLDQVAIKRLESGDILSELTACWSAVSGLAVDEIDPDRPIRYFTDSTMIIQFIHIASQKGWKFTFKSLTIHNTIRKQAQLLEEHGLEALPAVDAPLSVQMPVKDACKEPMIAKLRELGLTWDDVETVIPMTDYASNFSRDKPRPTAWNYRLNWSVENSMTEPQLLSIVDSWFARHPLLRCTSVVCNDDLEVFVVMRHHSRWRKRQIIHGGEVKDMEAVIRYRLGDPDYDYVNGAGPLFKIAIFKTQTPAGYGFVMHIHHCLYDALSLIRWIQDLKTLLKEKGNSTVQFHDYEEFATQYYEYRGSKSAKEGVDFQVSRLRGISSVPNTLWPPNVSVSKEKVSQEIASADLAPKSVDKACRTQGTNCYIRLPQLAAIQSQFAVTAPIIAITACALVNIRQTKAAEAVFTNLLSGRTWPLADDAQSNYRGNMLEVDGPTMTYTVSRIRVQEAETAVQLLQRVQHEQDQLAIYAHTPLNHINRKLKELDGEEGAADLSFIDTIYRRQSFDWLLEQYAEDESDAMKLIHEDSRNNAGFVWFPFLRDGNLLHLNVTYDHALLTPSEVHQVTSEFMCAAAWLSDPANAHKSLSECQFSGYEVAYQLPS